MEPKEALEKYILSEVIYNKRKNKIESEEDLLKSGIIDSMAIIKLVSFIQEEFNIRIDEEDLIPENFKNIKSMAKYVELNVEKETV